MSLTDTIGDLSLDEVMGLHEFLTPQEQQELYAAYESVEQRPFPQAGAQSDFYESDAKLTIYGGAAGAGKTFGSFLRHAKHMHIAGYTGAILRRTRVEITKPGGLWDSSFGVFPHFGARSRGGSDLDWILKHETGSRSRVQFAGVEYEKDIYKWQSTQLAGITIDEATHFTWKMVSYLMSRNRSVCGVRPFMDLTCNPDPNSYLVNMTGEWGSGLISWWIDEDGFPDVTRVGKLRWLVRVGDSMLWSDTYDEAFQLAIENGFSERDAEYAPTSVTFIPGNLDDNQKLMQANPEYRGNLMALSLVERLQLLGGNWRVSSDGGIIFQAEWFGEYDFSQMPGRFDSIIIAWDTATKAEEENDFTAGVVLGVTKTHYYVIDVVRKKWLAPDRFTKIKQHFIDWKGHSLVVEDKGSGQDLIQRYRAETSLPVIPYQPGTADKATRANRVTPTCEAGRVLLPNDAPWKAEFLLELLQFDGLPKKKSKDGKGKKYDDQVDAFVMALWKAIQGRGVHQMSRQREEYASQTYSSQPFVAPSMTNSSAPDNVNVF